MTYEKLTSLIKKNNIPINVKLESDSGWECGPTDMDGVYYNKSENKIIFTQGLYEEVYCEPEWSLLWKKISGLSNINERIRCDEKITLDTRSLFKDRYIKMIKEDQENNNEINLNQPLFWEIYLSDGYIYCRDFIGYVGISVEKNELEIYILKEYREKGYGKTVLKTIVNFAKEGRLKIYDKETDEIKAYIPNQVWVKVKKGDIAYVDLMKSCGFIKVEDTDEEFIIYKK